MFFISLLLSLVGIFGFESPSEPDFITKSNERPQNRQRTLIFVCLLIAVRDRAYYRDTLTEPCEFWRASLCCLRFQRWRSRSVSRSLRGRPGLSTYTRLIRGAATRRFSSFPTAPAC